MTLKRWLRLGAVAMLVTTVCACSALAHAGEGTRTPPLTVHAVQATLNPPGKGFVGVYEPSAPASYSEFTQFAKLVGRPPNLDLYYSDWYTPFQIRFAQTAYSHGATVLVQLEPNGISLQQIAAGKYDRYLKSYAAQVRSFGHPVILSFGHEMNGTWYTWGAGHVPASVFVAAWRHIVSLFRAAGADNVKWLWVVNIISSNAYPSVRPWWPGASWVDWIGIDGYYVHPSDTFQYIFEPTLQNIRTFTNKPVMISETGVAPLPTRPTLIQELFASVVSNHLIGLVWLDSDQSGGLYKQNWRLEGSPQSIDAFRQGMTLLKLCQARASHVSRGYATVSAGSAWPFRRARLDVDADDGLIFWSGGRGERVRLPGAADRGARPVRDAGGVRDQPGRPEDAARFRQVSR